MLVVLNTYNCLSYDEHYFTLTSVDSSLMRCLIQSHYNSRSNQAGRQAEACPTFLSYSNLDNPSFSWLLFVLLNDDEVE